jgi:hypothetical protein
VHSWLCDIHSLAEAGDNSAIIAHNCVLRTSVNIGFVSQTVDVLSFACDLQL